MQPGLSSDESIFIIGNTKDEMGGSEFYEATGNKENGRIPTVDLNVDRLNSKAVLKLIRGNVVRSLHDCSKGGLGISLCEMAMAGENGFQVYLDRVPNTCSTIYDLIFSESPSRYVVGTDDRDGVHRILSAIGGLKYSEIGTATSKGSDAILYHRKIGGPVTLSRKSIVRSYGRLGTIMEQNSVS